MLDNTKCLQLTDWIIVNIQAMRLSWTRRGLARASSCGRGSRGRRTRWRRTSTASTGRSSEVRFPFIFSQLEQTWIDIVHLPHLWRRIRSFIDTWQIQVHIHCRYEWTGEEVQPGDSGGGTVGVCHSREGEQGAGPQGREITTFHLSAILPSSVGCWA